ncbi:prolyl oligopeptidase family serine peptidase [Gammaproteobacteria bacterium]|nr:prolyl oligopeptidase family serine peptidase [Gammaproteobacteria bacterium]
MLIKVLFTLCVSLLISLQVFGKVYPIEEWSKRAQMSGVSISPDGSKMAMLRIVDTGGNPLLEIYDAADLSKRPFTMDSDPMEMTRFSWVADNKIIFSSRQRVRDKIDGWNQGVYDYSLNLLTLKDFKKREGNIKKLTQLGRRARLVDPLTKDPEHAIVGSYAKGQRSLTYYKFNINTNRKSQITRESENRRNLEFDGDAHPYLAYGYDGSINSQLTYHRAKGTDEWTVIDRRNRSDFESFDVVGYDPLDMKNLLVLAHNGQDTQGLWSFDPQEKEFKELIYGRSDGDVYAIRKHSNRYTQPDLITGVAFFDGRKRKFEWFDGQERAIYEQLETLIPFADRFRIVDRSRDGKTMVIENSGPRDPGTFYLLKNSELKVVGSAKPAIASKNLADVEAITYASSDGMRIKGFITIPNSEPPYPLVVMPHGGPFVPENPGFDEWAQMFANRGYMVLQPQFRGSGFLGLEYYKAGFINGGQGGFLMQDDKDYGALHLVDKGLADPNKLMMFGWSYGGYASIVAAAREPQIYNCVIAGGVVPDSVNYINNFRSQLNTRRDSADSQAYLNFWLDSVNPMEDVEKVNIPMLVIHGDDDQRTPAKPVEDYIELLEEHDKDFDVLWMEGADHFIDTWFHHHKLEMYTKIDNFIDQKCDFEREAVALR